MTAHTANASELRLSRPENLGNIVIAISELEEAPPKSRQTGVPFLTLIYVFSPRDHCGVPAHMIEE